VMRKFGGDTATDVSNSFKAYRARLADF
jgi:hypothetical protein